MDRNPQSQTVHPGYNMMAGDVHLQRKMLKIMCDVDKQCYMNIVFVR